MAKKQIKVLPNGPYEVTGNPPISQAIIATGANGESLGWQDGKSYPYDTTEPVHLCRCGHSKNKPFCDGTHTHNHFDGTETAGNIPYEQAAKRYEGQAVDLLDREQWCASARFCDVGDGVWQMAMESADPESKRHAIEEACNCPSGRLTIVEKDGTHIEPQLEQSIGLVEDVAADRKGPLWVRGGIEIQSADGQPYEVRNRVTLCRCGESSNLPFCDTSHMACPHMKGLDE
ncbi:CDGSH iron-sulfur domain-containing protein [Eubacteriales bacterium OttesenSCG-928-N14]|nr:CDGSH iron-sulfur domain-containing protein [Eubacteriales bacterium OttesenSCG-928-N14]